MMRVSFIVCFLIGVIVFLDVVTGGSFSNPSRFSQYEVISVYKGAVQVMDIGTGEYYQIYDKTLVKQAINGTIKKGDVIQLRR